VTLFDVVLTTVATCEIKKSSEIVSDILVLSSKKNFFAARDHAPPLRQYEIILHVTTSKREMKKI